MRRLLKTDPVPTTVTATQTKPIHTVCANSVLRVLVWGRG
jgi:hypothetical protein